MARTIAGRYRLDEELASGGFGTVWRAHDLTLRVDVAVKQVRLDPSATDAERGRVLARAEAEARNAAKLRDHPNIVAVHDVVVDEGVPWLVMRLVRGRSLHEELAARGHLHPDEAGKIAAGVLNALAAAHAERIVHRDVKPANIMLADDGTVLLTDFGIAKHHGDTSQTSRGMLVGSLPYMSPERLDGQDSAAGDLFALGVTLYEMTEGVSPFARDTPTAVMAAVARFDPDPPTHAGRLTGLSMALLEKDDAQRPDARAALAMLAAGGGAAVTVQHRQTKSTSQSAPPISRSGPSAKDQAACAAEKQATDTASRLGAPGEDLQNEKANSDAATALAAAAAEAESPRVRSAISNLAADYQAIANGFGQRVHDRDAGLDTQSATDQITAADTRSFSDQNSVELACPLL